MPPTAPGDVQRSRLLAEPRRALLTPSASPSVGPPDRPPTKRPRLRSTPSSAISATPSTSNESTTSTDVNSARRASTLRVLNTWAQLAERYNKRLDEDDIIDLHRYVIIKNRGVVDGASKEYDIGHFTLDGDQDYPDGDQDQEESEQDDDDNELGVLPPSETTTDDDAPISKKELLRGVPPLSATTDAEDLREFLEAERKRREVAGGDEDEEEMSPEQRVALREELEERVKKREEAATANQARDVASGEPTPDDEVDATPRRPSTCAPPSDDESEDELALWTHDESTAVYPITRDESEQDVREVEQEVIELTDSDSDEEFEAILTHPPRFNQVTPPLPAPHPKEAQPGLQSPPDSERGRPKSRQRSHSKAKSAKAIPKSDRPLSPIVTRKPHVTPAEQRSSPVSKEPTTVPPDDSPPDDEVVSRIPRSLKGKGKEISATIDGNHREKTPKSVGVVSRGRKRKRNASSSVNGSPSAQSLAEPKSTPQGKPIARSPSTIPQSNGLEPTLDEDLSTPELAGRGRSRSLSSFTFSSKSRPPTLPAPAFRSFECESEHPTSHDHDYDGHPPSDTLTPVIHPHFQRPPSHPPTLFSSPSQGAPGVPLHPPPLDPVQAQQAHYLLAQAMHHLSYLLSAAMPYTGYTSNPGQPWHQPPPALDAAYNTPTHHPPHPRHYHTPSSSISCPGLPPSSPIRSSVPPPHEEQRARSRGRSKSRGRRVSFKLDGAEVDDSDLEHDTPAEHGGQKNRKEAVEPRRKRGKGSAAEEFDDSLRSGDRGNPPREVARGRTPGPPDRKITDVPRGRSLSRR